MLGLHLCPSFLLLAISCLMPCTWWKPYVFWDITHLSCLSHSLRHSPRRHCAPGERPTVKPGLWKETCSVTGYLWDSKLSWKSQFHHFQFQRVHAHHLELERSVHTIASCCPRVTARSLHLFTESGTKLEHLMLELRNTILQILVKSICDIYLQLDKKCEWVMSC